jgi:hypothetical protein
MGATYCTRVGGCPGRAQTNRWNCASARARAGGGGLLLALYICSVSGSVSNKRVLTGERAATLPEETKSSRARPSSSKLERAWLLSRTTGDLVTGVNCAGAACDEEKRETARAQICRRRATWVSAWFQEMQRRAIFKNYTYHEM